MMASIDYVLFLFYNYWTRFVSVCADESDSIPVKEPASSGVVKEKSLAEKELLILDREIEDKLKSIWLVNPFSQLRYPVFDIGSNNWNTQLKLAPNSNSNFIDISVRRLNRRENRGARSARCNSEILSSMLLQPQQPSKSSTSAGGAAASDLTVERPRSALLLPPLPAPSVLPAPSGRPATTSSSSSPGGGAGGGHSPFYLYMADVPRTRHYESLESLQHDRFTTIGIISLISILTHNSGLNNSQFWETKFDPLVIQSILILNQPNLT